MRATPNFRLKLTVKEWFFDRLHVIDRVKRANKGALGRQGALIRRTARWSLKRVTPKQAERAARLAKIARRNGRKFRDPTVSRPGKPPKIHTPGDLNPKKILYAFEPMTETVLVGPMRFNTKHNVPETLEKGGRVPIYSGRRKKRRLVRSVMIEPRPFMAPAEKKVRKKFGEQLANSVKPR
ncbi:MAG: hypothetical protein ACIALR_14865 [Blastopirellula sp. JB062]